MKCEWEDIKGYEGLYRISNTGKIYSMKSNMIMKTPVAGNGYQTLTVRKNGKKKTLYVHRLVAIAFLANPENKPLVNHDDGNKLNCNEQNLEWATHSENNQHAYDNNLISRVGEKNNQSKLTEVKVSKIRNLHKTGNYSYKKLSKIFNISFQQISNIITYKSWKCVGEI